MSKIAKISILHFLLFIVICVLYVYGLDNVTEASSIVVLTVVFAISSVFNFRWYVRYVKKIENEESKAK